jgi:hypothetical protein
MAMRRVLQVCGVAAVLASLGCVHVPVTEAQGIISELNVPPISAVTPRMPIEVSVSIPIMVSQPVMPGMSVGQAGAGTGSEGQVTHTSSRTSEPATIKLGE